MSLVGRFGLRFNGRPIELRTRKAGAVLGYLALSEMKQESRERLVGLLWSRSDEEKARASLRQVVRELRSVLEEAGYGGFVAERLLIGIDTGQVEVDIESVLQLAEGGARPSAAARYSSSLTSGCSKAWTISIRRSASGCWPSGRPSMNG